MLTPLQDGESPLHKAVVSQTMDVIEAFVNLGMDPNIQNAVYLFYQSVCKLTQLLCFKNKTTVFLLMDLMPFSTLISILGYMKIVSLLPSVPGLTRTSP